MFEKISIAAIATAIFSSGAPAPTTISVKVDYTLASQRGTLIVIGNRDTVLEASANQLAKLSAKDFEREGRTPHSVARIYNRENKQRGPAIAECTRTFSASSVTVFCSSLPSSLELKPATVTRAMR